MESGPERTLLDSACLSGGRYFFFFGAAFLAAFFLVAFFIVRFSLDIEFRAIRKIAV